VTPIQILSWLQGIEVNSAYTKLKYFNVDCWPVVRLTIASLFIQSNLPVASTTKRGVGNYLKAVIRLVFSFLKLEEKDALVLTNSKFSDEINGKKYYKDAAALIENAKLRELSMGLFFSDLHHGYKTTEQAGVSVFGVSVIARFLSGIFVRIAPRSSFNSINRLVDLELRAIVGANASMEETQMVIKKNILFVIIARYLFIKILMKVKPKEAYIVCFYSNLGLAFCSACKTLNIKVTDVQHGVSGRNMRAYGGWKALPSRGYNTLPSDFYTWTTFDLNAINEWSGDTNAIEVICTGSLWRSYMIDNGLMLLAEEEWKNFFDSVSHYRKHILFTSQSLTVAALFKEIILKAQPGVCFLIRCHPNLKSDDVGLLNKVMREFGPNVFVNAPTKMPIELLMQNVDWHITEWSASVYNAYFEEVKSIVITEEGKDYFSDFIENGMVFYMNDVESILEKIEVGSDKYMN